ncbi:unnamed protein product [Lactuca virosa]|uniref:Uncharacterized protein n=1 Tax=Lactuca virosa TaxID=75947 RepID=A0AAU9NRM5_9ASTR|nr:unnamed protein product [Lactuca virosa]
MNVSFNNFQFPYHQPSSQAFLRILVLNSWCSSISLHHPARSRFSNQSYLSRLYSNFLDTIMDETKNSDDFTFWQVGDEKKNEPKGLPDVSSMSIEDKNKSSGTIWGDNSNNKADVAKQEKVGSLTFKVIDASSQRKSTEPSKQAAGVDVESSNNASQKPKSVGKKPVSRAKVPYQIGYSHMDWLKVTRTHPDLAGNSIL